MIEIETLNDKGECMVTTSSKGNQNKWLYKGRWYKEDSLGYESLAEILVSGLLSMTNVSSYVKYNYEAIKRNGIIYNACVSENFLTDEDDKLISIARLFRTLKGYDIEKEILKWENTADRIEFVVSELEEITGIAAWGTYLLQLITIDTLFFNEDRHFNNIAIIQRKDGTYRTSPIFDQGASLFSDITYDYPLSRDVREHKQRIKAKPFSDDFDEQLDVCEMLYPEYRFRASFGIEDVLKILSDYKGIYDDMILERIESVMRGQIKKYQYLFINPPQ